VSSENTLLPLVPRSLGLTCGGGALVISGGCLSQASGWKHRQAPALPGTSRLEPGARLGCCMTAALVPAPASRDAWAYAALG